MKTSELLFSIGALLLAASMLIVASCGDDRTERCAGRGYGVVEVAQRLNARADSNKIDIGTAYLFICESGPSVVDEFGPLLASADHDKQRFAGAILARLVNAPAWPNLIPFISRSLKTADDRASAELLFALCGDGAKGHKELLPQMGPYLDQERSIKTVIHGDESIDLRACDVAAYVVQQASTIDLGLVRFSRATPEAVARARNISRQ
jgi:hypothetical protein